MAVRYELRTFKDIVDAVMEACQIQSTDTVERNRIKRNVQQVYGYEVLPYKQWHWLRGTANLQTQPYFGTGTATVTSGSCVVTLTDAPSISRREHFFSVEGSNVKYRILAHTASSTTVTLEIPYGESTSATARFKIWTDSIPLPNDLEEVIELRHGHHIKPVTNLGLQELRRLESTNTKAEGHPSYYTTTDYKDPEGYAAVSGLPASATRASSGLVKTIKFVSSLGATEPVSLIRPGDQIEVVVSGADGFYYSGHATVGRLFTTTLTNDTISYTGRTEWSEAATADATISIKKLESEGYDRYREIMVYPGIFNARIGLELDYIKQAIPLEGDTDEPALPSRDRIVLYYGALYHTWTRKRNPEEAAAARSLFQAKLDKMAGKTEDSPDKPQMVPSKLYMGAKRSGQRIRSRGGQISFGGSGATTAPSGTASQVAIFGSDGYLQSSTLISTLELDALNGIDSNIQDQIDSIVVGTGLSDGSITTVKLSDSAVTTAKISDGSITAAKLGTALAATITSKANIDLGNLSATAINADLVPVDGTKDLGSAALPWLEGHIEEIITPLIHSGTADAVLEIYASDGALGGLSITAATGTTNIWSPLVTFDGTAVVSGSVNMISGGKIINLGTPTAGADAATKAYVDSLSVPHSATFTNNGGPTMLPGEVLAIQSDGTVLKADADVVTNSQALGINVTVGATSSSGVVIIGAGAIAAGYTGLTPGLLYYVSATAGETTATAPSGSGQTVYEVGRAISATQIVFQPRFVTTYP